MRHDRFTDIRARVSLCVCVREPTESRVNPGAGSRPNTFSVSTVRQLVCGSSRNLNPMILGTDPSRVPNPRREPPPALKAAAAAATVVAALRNG